MRVLWFTNTSSLYQKGNHHYNGGGWIKSLEQLITDKTDFKLGISFFHATDSAKQENENATYYPVLKKKKSGIKKLLTNWSGKIDSTEYLSDFLKIIEDFKPDIIQVFGTENAFSLIQPFTKVPVVIHMQGLILPYENAFYPSGINYFNILFEKKFFKKNLLGNSLLFDKKRFKNQAKRELQYFKAAKYLMGRTAWDKSISGLLAPQAGYYHVDEVLRPIFYSEEAWHQEKKEKIIIVSTLSNTVYKGFDVILKTARLLKENTDLLFEWQIAGINKNDKIVSFFERHVGVTCSDCNVSIMGAKESQELISILKGSDIFIHPSYIENSPNSICEAQIIGIPVVACNSGGVSTIIENEVSGILVPANAPHELAARIKELITDDAKKNALGKEGRKSAQLRHDRDKILLNLTTAYKNIITDSKCKN